MVFEWDVRKATANAKKHGVTFHEAATVFGDPLAIAFADPDHSMNENRSLLSDYPCSIGCWLWRILTAAEKYELSVRVL